MKQNMFDFLDDYADDSVMIEENAPLSGKRIRTLTMQRIPKRTGKLRLLARPLAAAAAVAAMGIVSIAAAGALGAGDWFRDFFGPLSDEQSSVVETMSKELAGVSASNGATLTPLAVLVDENVCYLRLRIEAPEGTTLGALPEGCSYKLYGDENGEQVRLEPVDKTPYNRGFATGDGGTVRAYGFGYGLEEFDLPDDDPTDNVIETMLRFTADQAMAEKGVRFNDGVSKRLTLGGLWIMSPDIRFEEVFRADFTLEIDSRFESHAIPLTCAGAAWTDENGITYTVDHLQLSPLTLSFHYTSDLPMCDLHEARQMRITPDDLPHPNAFTLIRKDGSAINCKDFALGSECTGFSINERDWQPYWSLWDYIVFDEPLDLSLVDHVEYGGHSIAFSMESPDSSLG